MPETHREMALRHVLSGRRIVDGQWLLVEHLKGCGRPSQEAEQLLDAFEVSLRIFEDDLEGILRKEDK